MDRRRLLRSSAAGALVLLTPRGGALARSPRPLALVTADLEASVLAVDLLTGVVRARVPTPPGPSSIETVGRGHLALVGHAGAGAVSLLDARTLRVRRVLEGLGEPRYAAASPAGRYAYITDAARGELVVIDLWRGRISDRVEVGERARHLTISPDGSRLWAALGPRAPAVAVIDADDPARPRLLRTQRPLDLAHDVVCALGDGRIWVTSGVEERVAVHDARSGRALARLASGAPPQHVAMGPGLVYVASGADGTLRAHAPDGRLLRRTRIPLDSYNVTAGHGRVVTPSLMLGTVTLLAANGRFLRRERLTQAAHDACIT